MEITPITVVERAMDQDSEIVQIRDLVPSPPPARPSGKVPKVLRPATPQERFAAFFTDTLIIFGLSIAGLIVLKYIFHSSLINFSPTSFSSFKKTNWMLLGSSAGAFYFLYYLLFEGVITSTPGKLLGGLSVRKKNGKIPSIFAILIRNLFRFIDYPLFFLTAIGFMEMTPYHQRLGDFLSGTVVMRKAPLAIPTPGVGLRLAGATRRLFAFALDLIPVVIWTYGLMLLIPTDNPFMSKIFLNLVPLGIFLYVTITEYFFQATFGKALLGARVVQEDYHSAPFSIILIRNFLKILDMNPIGYLCIFLSSKKQSPGNAASGTMVIRDFRSLRGWLSVPFMILLAVTALYFGAQNPHNFLKRNMNIRVGPYRIDPLPAQVRRYFLTGLQVEKLEFGVNEQDVSKTATYHPGDVVYLFFRIAGYKTEADRIWVQTDIKVRDAQGNVTLDKPNAIDARLPIEGRQSAKLVTRFALHPQTPVGTYHATIIVRDMLADQVSEETEVFTVK